MNNNIKLTYLEALITRDSSGAIQKSERREQLECVNNSRLPIKTNDYSVPREVRYFGITEDMKEDYQKQFQIEKENNIKWTKQQYEKMGIKIINEYDDLFYEVELPIGWSIKDTTHSMWNEVFDDKNRKRISFFYKGSFYDREAFSNFVKRYGFSEIPFDDYKTDSTYEERKSKPYYGVVYDCDTEIFRTEGIINKDYFDETLKNQCKEYLDSNYPNWDNIINNYN